MTTTQENDEDIWRVVRHIRDSPYRTLDAFQKKVREDEEWFFTKYPTLAEMCLTSETFDENALRYMIAQKNQVNNTITQHDASVSVGEHLAQKYIPAYRKR